MINHPAQPETKQPSQSSRGQQIVQGTHERVARLAAAMTRTYRANLDVKALERYNEWAHQHGLSNIGGL